MEIIEYQCKLLESGHLSLPNEIYEKLKGKERVRVVLYLEDESQEVYAKEGDERTKNAMAEYKAKYPDDDVNLSDFRFVGILQDKDLKASKNELIDTIGAKYDDQ